jgi:hypothetical protein
MTFLSEWPQEAPRFVPYEMYSIVTPEVTARDLFKKKHNDEPKFNFICGKWRYAGPIPNLDK